MWNFAGPFWGPSRGQGIHTNLPCTHPCTDNPRHKTTTRPHIEWTVGPVLRPNNGPISGAIFWTLFWDRPRGTNSALHFVVAVFWARKRPLFWGRGRAPKHDQKTEKSHSFKHYLFFKSNACGTRMTLAWILEGWNLLFQNVSQKSRNRAKRHH